MSVCSAAQGTMLPLAAVLYSGWKLNGLPEQLSIEVFWKPLTAEACMKPLCPVVKSVTITLKALVPLSPGTGASSSRTVTRSPGFISSVCEFGVNVCRSVSCGLGGPAGTPSFWMKAKLTGSSHWVLHFAKPSVHSRLSIVSAEHQWLLSQLTPSANGAKPGG